MCFNTQDAVTEQFYLHAVISITFLSHFTSQISHTLIEYFTKT